MMDQIQFEFWRYTPLILSALGQTVFLLFYALPRLGAGPWWTDPVGRAIFIKSSTLDLLLITLLLSFISRWTNGEYSNISFHVTKYEGNLEYLIILGYWAVTFGVFYQMAALLHQRRKANRGRKQSVKFEV